MKRLFLLLGLAVSLVGCTKQLVKSDYKSPEQTIRVVDPHGEFTLVTMTDGKMYRIGPNDTLLFSNVTPNWTVKRTMSNTETARIPIEACRCDEKQLVDCYKSQEELTRQYADDVMATFYKLTHPQVK